MTASDKSLPELAAEAKRLVSAFKAELKLLMREEMPDTSMTVKSDLLEKAVMKDRQLVGAKKIRSGRPMTDMMRKIQKKQRKALKSALLRFKKGLKKQQKALLENARKSAKGAYSKHHHH